MLHWSAALLLPALNRKTHTMAILPDLTQLSREQLEQMVAALAAKPATRVTLKVSEKGAVCLYGLGRFPVTLYASQWERLLSEAETIKAFITANASRLARKD